METTTDIIVYFLRMFISNMCVYYCFEKILNLKENRLRNNIILFCINIILIFVYVHAKLMFESFLPFIALWIIYAIILSKLTKNKLGYSMIVTLIAYAISFIFHTLSVIIQFIPYKLIYKVFNIDSKIISLVIISIIQIILVYSFFKIKRFRNGFAFFNNKLNNEITDIIMINISSILIIVYCLFATYPKEIRQYVLFMFFVLCITMFFTIKKMITMYYKQKLLTDTMEQYKVELVEKQNEIEQLKSDKQNVSKITHEFYNRQKALELIVASNMNGENIDKDGVSQNVLAMIESLTSEYSERYDSIKKLPELEKTDVPEIDNMFKYMQNECKNNDIDFKLKVIGNIHYLVNNIIPKSKLETLIGDHLRDAINAVKLSDTENKEILAVLGTKNKKYELSIFDTGIEFEVDTLVKLGLEAVTTNAERGGTGTGFMTTFETLNETKASLIITEYPKEHSNYYTKCVTIRFDGKNQYRICSYRAKEIKEKTIDNRIRIEQYNKNESK